MSKIRTLAIAILKNDKNQILLHEGFDSIKKEKFYRPLGGGIEFGEKGDAALVREFQEEISQEITVIKLLNTFENIFTYEGKPGHQIILVYEAKMTNQSYLPSYDIIESGEVVGQAVWRTLTEIREQNAKLYPLGIEAYI